MAVLWLGVDAAAVCVAAAVLFTVGCAVAASCPAAGLLVADTDVDAEGEGPAAAAAMPMTKMRPQNARNAVSSLCVATHGFRPGGLAGGR